MFKKILGYFKKELQLNKEYYQNLHTSELSSLLPKENAAVFPPKSNPPRIPATREGKKSYAQDLIEIAKFYAVEINTSTTVFDFVYSYREFQRIVKELIRLNEKKGVYMYPPPRHELERAESSIEATINSFISRAIRKIWSSGMQWADDVDFLLDEIEADKCLSHLLTQGNRDQIFQLRKQAKNQRQRPVPLGKPNSNYNIAAPHYSGASTALLAETSSAFSIDFDQIIRDENEWRRQQRGLSPVEYELAKIDSMDGHAFENWCADLLRKIGFSDVQITQGSGDQGIDILATKDGIHYAIQCKCYSSDLGNKPIQEVNTGKVIYHCQIGAVMTNRYFTVGGKAAAEATGTLLWDRTWLQAALEQT